MSGSVHAERLRDEISQLSAQMSGQCFGQLRKLGPRCSREAYVSEELKSFAVKVEIIRDVSTVCGPNDFGKSRV